MIFRFMKSSLLLIVVLILVSPFSKGYAFIPEGADIVKLAVEKIVEPKGLIVEQKRKVFFDRKSTETTEEAAQTTISQELGSDALPVEAPGEPQVSNKELTIQEETIIDEPEGEEIEPSGTEPSFIEINEKLWFSYPGKFRSEAVTNSHDMLCVESNGKFIKIVDEFIESKEKSFIDLYIDILLHRQQETLIKKLKASGVNLSVTSLKRHEGIIYFVVGQPPVENMPSSSFWVEKDSNFPGRYTIQKDGLFIDIFYKDWQKVSRTWYPMQISVFLDGTLFSEIDTEKFELEADFKKDLFNVKKLVNIFPESGNYKNEPDERRDELDELEKSIEAFKKLYE
jgi:hypothetical protein